MSARRERLAGRHDVEHRQLAHPLGVIERQAIGARGRRDRGRRRRSARSRAGAITATWSRAIARLAYGAWSGVARRLAAVAVAAQVGGDHREVLRQPRRDLVPHDVRLRDTRAAAAAAVRCRRAAPGSSPRRCRSSPRQSLRTCALLTGMASGNVFRRARRDIQRGRRLRGCRSRPECSRGGQSFRFVLGPEMTTASRRQCPRHRRNVPGPAARSAIPSGSASSECRPRASPRRASRPDRPARPTQPPAPGRRLPDPRSMPPGT